MLGENQKPFFQDIGKIIFP